MNSIEEGLRPDNYQDWDVVRSARIPADLKLLAFYEGLRAASAIPRCSDPPHFPLLSFLPPEGAGAMSARQLDRSRPGSDVQMLRLEVRIAAQHLPILVPGN
jgi:hypothetical protein